MKKKIHYRGLLLALLMVSAAILGLPLRTFAQEEGLKLYDSQVTFKHFAYELNQDNTLKSYDKNTIVDTKFNTKVLENQFIKVTLLPEYGGRILSIIYKPTGHELLYQNPVGTPYGIGENNFFYNWLMVYGGIFPTFPEPEHGKTWNLPWEFKVTAQDEDKISIEMRYTDHIPPTSATPPSFSKGETGITCVATVTVYRKTSNVDYNIKLINNQNQPVGYEYWTCTTFAPGSEPGNTLCPPNSEIIAPVSQVVLKDDWWSWMGSAEKAVNKGKHLFEYKNLALLSNWADMGIAYASPAVEKEWWGVINHENEEGILRIANNKQDTPGMKFWTWGDKSRNTDIKTFGDSSRPYIELWAGNSLEFFKNTQLAAREEKAWNEYYMPTAGLSKITYANKHAAVDLDNNHASIFTTHPEESLSVAVILKGATEQKLLDQTFTSDPKKANTFTLPKPEAPVGKGEYTYELTLKSASGEVLAQTTAPYTAVAAEAKPDALKKTQEKTVSSGGNHSIAAVVSIAAGILVFLALVIFIASRKKKA